MSKVLVGMSGGVDSSVTAFLLKQAGHEVVGATMLLYDSGLEAHVGGGSEAQCCGIHGARDAQSVAETIGIEHVVLDFRDLFESCVIRPFGSEYERARTPNPCIECNRHLKFKAMLARAREMGCDAVATGHYARIERVGDRWALGRAADEGKDQTYVLYAMDQDQLAHTLLPLGGIPKSRVREIAAEQGFSNAKKPESQDICFVPDGDHLGFMERYSGHTGEPGDIVSTDGTVLGRHLGLDRYTIGQRKGIGIAAPWPLFVIDRDAENNRLVVGRREELASAGCIARDWVWGSRELAIGESMPAMVKTYYRQTALAATVTRVEADCVRVTYRDPARKAAPGQAVVAYDGDYVLGGGTIESAFSEQAF